MPPNIPKPANILKADMVNAKIAVEDFSVFIEHKPILRQLNLQVFPGERLAIIGPAGSGKSTLIRSLNRLNDLAHQFTRTGRILLDGQDIFSSAMNVAALRRRVGLVSSTILPLPGSIFENVAVSLRLAGMRDHTALCQRVTASLQQVYLWTEVQERLDSEALRLNSEQQQRLTLARVLALSPEVLLLDEPGAGLDPLATNKFEDILDELKAKITMVLVTNDNQQAARASERTAFLLNGELVECGPTEQIFFNPAQARTHDYITGRF